MKRVFLQVNGFLSTIGFCIKFCVKTSKKYFVLCILLNIIAVILPFAIIYLTSTLVNSLAESLVSSDESLLELIGYNFLIIAVSLFAMNFLAKLINSLKFYFQGLYEEIMQKNGQVRLMEKTAEIDLSHFDSYEFYDEIRDTNANTPLIIQTMFNSIDFIRNAASFLIAFTYLAQFNIFYSIILSLSVIPSFYFQNKQLEAIYSFQREHMSEERKMYYNMDIVINRKYAKDLRIYGLFPLIHRKFQSTWKVLFENKKRITKRYTKRLAFFSLFPEAVSIFIIIHLGWLVLQKQGTLGDFTYYQGIVSQVLVGVELIILNYSQISDGKARIQNFIKFLNIKNKVNDSGNILLEEEPFAIEFRNVSFRYGEKLPYVLKDLYFTIKSGEKVALVGVNGCGKTTIIKLILRFYDPSEGTIYLNGRDIREYQIDGVRKRFSTMLQDYCNYAYSVRETVSLSDWENAGDTQRIHNAIHKGVADVFVDKFPQKINTFLTREYEEDGEELSGGQWQKIALSRAFFHDADFYILDEPSSSLDAEAEEELFQQFDILCQDKGAIMVSHRLSNITKCDRVIVLDGGKMIESGTHKELLELGGKYSKMYMLQAKKYTLS